ncbi:MAG: hypothetical protein AAGH64_12155, partial [Planctomycetota bacterium]
GWVSRAPAWGGAGGVAPGVGGGVRASYTVRGRTDARRWTLRAGDTMVAIGFDPITGVPSLHRER